MSALTTDGLFHLEYLVRSEADRIRFRNPEIDQDNAGAVSAGAKTHVQGERRRAAEFDQIGNLLSGLQADWDELGPKVRAGYVRQRKEYEGIRDQGTMPAEDVA